jgi:hypothetical protein
MVNKSNTGNERQRRLRERRRLWLVKHAHGISVDGLMGMIVRGDVKLVWVKRPVTVTKRH